MLRHIGIRFVALLVRSGGDADVMLAVEVKEMVGTAFVMYMLVQ